MKSKVYVPVHSTTSIHYINYQLLFTNLVSILAWCARSIGRRLTFTVEAKPCFAADIISCITVLHTLQMNVSRNVSTFGNSMAKLSLKQIGRLVSFFYFFMGNLCNKINARTQEIKTAPSLHLVPVSLHLRLL